MSTSRERVFDVLDVATKPIQWLIGGIKLLLFGAFLVVVAIGTPIYMLCTGQSVTGDMVALAFIAILAVIAFFYTPYYFWLGGIATVLGIAWLIEKHEGFVDAVVGHGLHFKLFVICWLLFGILRKFIWRGLSECAKPNHPAASTTRCGGGIGRAAREVGDARRDPDLVWEELTPEAAARAAAHRDRELADAARAASSAKAESAKAERSQRTIPSPSDDSVNRDIQSLLAAARKADCKSCEDAFRVLEAENGTDPASVKDAYRDLAKVWHPDRFGDGDTRLKKKAGEHFKRIHAAYTHLQEHQPPSSPDIDFEKMPLQKAIDTTTAANWEVARITDSLTRWMATTGLANRDDAIVAMRQFLILQQGAVNRLHRLVARFERELPEFPRAELESVLADVKARGAKLTGVAVKAGLIQSR